MTTRTLFRSQYWSILKLFYENHNTPVHLREISRRIGIKESSTFLHLNSLEKAGILQSKKDANLKKYSIRRQQIPLIFPLFDTDRLESLPFLRKNAVKEYLAALVHKPALLIVFGSTAKGTFNDSSDIDILQVSGSSKESGQAKKSAEALTGQNLQVFRVSEARFYKELKLKQDYVVQSAIETGFPVFNKEYFYCLIYNE
ncbi:MAG TPA: hypothetical protein ENN46_02540 [Candidatus Woesearchaeota archaeon]|nr:hypothetical protein [Candidatus Woesearchaeota archaeon]